MTRLVRSVLAQGEGLRYMGEIEDYYYYRGNGGLKRQI